MATVTLLVSFVLDVVHPKERVSISPSLQGLMNVLPRCVARSVGSCRALLRLDEGEVGRRWWQTFMDDHTGESARKLMFALYVEAFGVLLMEEGTVGGLLVTENHGDLTPGLGEAGRAFPPWVGREEEMSEDEDDELRFFFGF